jgi:hypothetical protein
MLWWLLGVGCDAVWGVCALPPRHSWVEVGQGDRVVVVGVRCKPIGMCGVVAVLWRFLVSLIQWRALRCGFSKKVGKRIRKREVYILYLYYFQEVSKILMQAFVVSNTRLHPLHSFNCRFWQVAILLIKSDRMTNEVYCIIIQSVFSETRKWDQRESLNWVIIKRYIFRFWKHIKCTWIKFKNSMFNNFKRKMNASRITLEGTFDTRLP